MPRNEKTPHAFDYSPDLRAGRADLQSPCQFFLDSLFAGCSILDVGAGLGQSKARFRHNRATTYDIDPRLRPFVDVAGGEIPRGPFDIVSSFDVLEHVEDDRRLLNEMAHRAARAVFVSTPNWYVSRCQSTHHFREYTGAELRDLAASIWSPETLRLFAHFKDRHGSWFEMVPDGLWDQHLGTKHNLLVLLREDDRARIDGFYAGRWGKLIDPAERWVPVLGDGDTIPPPVPVLRAEPAAAKPSEAA